MNNQLREAVVSVIIDRLNESKPVSYWPDLIAKSKAGLVSPASKSDTERGEKDPTTHKGPYKKMIKGKVLQMQSSKSKKPGKTAQGASIARRDDKAVERRIAKQRARRDSYFSYPSRGED